MKKTNWKSVLLYIIRIVELVITCLLYTSDAADD